MKTLWLGDTEIIYNGWNHYILTDGGGGGAHWPCHYRISLSSDFLFHRLSCMLTSQTISSTVHVLGLEMVVCIVRLLFVSDFSNLQCPRLHSRISKCCPGQSFPPFKGDGLVQSRVRVMAPRPQVSLHPENRLHSLQPPSTAIKQIISPT